MVASRTSSTTASTAAYADEGLLYATKRSHIPSNTLMCSARVDDHQKERRSGIDEPALHARRQVDVEQVALVARRIR